MQQHATAFLCVVCVCVCLRVDDEATQAASRVREGVGVLERGRGRGESTPIDSPTVPAASACSPKGDVLNVGRVRTCVRLARVNG